MKALVAIICFGFLVMPLMAHHSFAMYDQTKTLTFAGQSRRASLRAARSGWKTDARAGWETNHLGC
jgi:hypothetical protein